VKEGFLEQVKSSILSLYLYKGLATAFVRSLDLAYKSWVRRQNVGDIENLALLPFPFIFNVAEKHAVVPKLVQGFIKLTDRITHAGIFQKSTVTLHG
jgi:hypothetical protein